MGLFSGLGKLFKKREPAPEIPTETLPEAIPSSFGMTDDSTIENIKVKMDLIATHFDTLRTQYEVLNEKISVIEKMVKEMYQMAKS